MNDQFACVLQEKMLKKVNAYTNEKILIISKQ